MIDEFTYEISNQVQILSNDYGSKVIKAGDKNIRFARRRSQDYLVEAAAFDKNYIKSSSLFQREVEVILSALKNIEKRLKNLEEKSETNAGRLIHNLKSLTAKTTQEIYLIALQSELMGDQRRVNDYLAKEISKDPKGVAKALVSILKYQTAQKTEFSAFHKLNGSVDTLVLGSHRIHKVIMSVFYLFFNDFNDKGVKINVNQSDLMGKFDYDSMHVAFFHIIENSAKYTKTGSDISVLFDRSGSGVSVTFEMESLIVKPEERDKIFLEGYSGVSAKKNSLAGGGVGLYIAKKMAELNGGSLIFIPGMALTFDGNYARNKFIFNIACG